MAPTRIRHGARVETGGTRFIVWAPLKQSIEVVFDDGSTAVTLDRRPGGYFEAIAEGIGPGARYRLRVDGHDAFPDPASRFQPDGVHGSSEVVDPSGFSWDDEGWAGIPLEEMLIYELHVGTFTDEGTFDALRQRLPYLHDLGINTIELMPVADFPGRWNWGYDHAALFAPSRAYGRPDDLRRLVNDAHEMGMAVILDVIYNHFGPDGAYAPAFAPFFTEKHHTPWGAAVNLDDEHSTGVRAFFIDNALYWLEEFHLDGLRLDATHALIDDSDRHFLIELSEAVASIDRGPRRILIAEDHRNLNTVLRTREDGGYGIDAVWADDFHHLIRNRTAGDHESYYASFAGAGTEQIARTINRGWFFEGQKTARGAPRGTDPSGLRPEQFVFFIQNHDQVGNRPLGNRLTEDVPLPIYRALSALLLFLPQTPMLFMGQEWAARSPFLFFTDHNEELGRAVTEGRRKEFEDFEAFRGDVPDPQDEASFLRSKLVWDERERAPHAGVDRMYRDLLALRKTVREAADASAPSDAVLAIRRGDLTMLVAFEADADIAVPRGAEVVWHSEQPEYADDAHPPQLSDDRLRFPRPSAAILRS